MKLVLFAHTPPPQHGQSVMVQLMLEGLGGNHGRNATPPGIEAASPTPSARAFGIECFHVNARLSDDLEDVGQPRWGKIILLLKYCIKAIALRLRHGISTLYYVPSPPKRASLYRDWVVMLLCRPFFRRIVFHWHAVGLGEWLQRHARPWERHLTHALLGRANLAIVLSRFNESDSARLHPRHTRVVSNGIPDPCPDYGTRIAPLRAARARERLRHLDGKGHSQADQAMTSEPTPLVNVLYMAHCTRDKGLFDAVEGVRQANQALASSGSLLRFQLTVAGSFLTAQERAEFRALTASSGMTGWVRHVGFISGPQKEEALTAADIFCFPTYFANEGQPVNLIEAMAHGLPVVTTRWRAIPEFIPAGYPGLIDPRRPDQVAKALLALLPDDGQAFRDVFLRTFTLEKHLSALARALHSLEEEASLP